VDQLKQRLKKLSDYDEIKRELEIMKVSPGFLDLFHMAHHNSCEVCRVLGF